MFASPTTLEYRCHGLADREETRPTTQFHKAGHPSDPMAGPPERLAVIVGNHATDGYPRANIRSVTFSPNSIALFQPMPNPRC